MPGINNNLYPPIVDSYMPAFVRTTSCRVYFSLSNYNSVEDIKNVQVIICNQNNNTTVLDEDQYPAGIKITSLNVDGTIDGDAKYYITIAPGDLDGGIFELNQYYKVQIRFTGTGAATLTDSKKIASWLTANQSYFSEWSTVCLIKGIQKPILYIKGFEEESESSNDTVFTTEVVDFIGQMYFEENADIEKEYLKYYRIKLYDDSSDELLFDSGNVYTNEYNPNEINYNLPYGLEDGISYKAEISYTTNNEYSNSNTYVFSVIQTGVDTLNATITATEDVENGRIRIDIIATVTEAFLGNLTIRRTSSESDFTLWEDVNTSVINNGTALDYTWYDYTVKSGVWYKYAAQKRNSKGDRGISIQIRNPVMMEFESVFLTTAEMQLKVKFDASISSFKKTLSESRTETIGSKYPHFRRNGNIGYRQFPLSGLITAFCDEDGVFLSKDIIYGDMRTYYDIYNEDNDIDEYQDYIYEREFREKIMEFLYNNDVKLFRSNTEGNMLIKLMDVSFTPNQTLGRMLYSFSATAYEIDECSLDNYGTYKIQEVGDWSSYPEYTSDKVGQITGTFAANQNIFSSLQSKYEETVTDGFIITVTHLSWLRLEFESDPYLIKTLANGDIEPLSASDTPNENTAYGYIVYINDEPIIVSKRGFYELKDNDTYIVSVRFPVATTATIDYIAELEEEEVEDTSQIASKIYYYTKVGQISGLFAANSSVYKQIYLKYLESYKAYYQKLITIDKMIIEAEPGSVLYLKDSFDDDYYRHVIGPTGILELYDEDTTVSNFYFAGVHLYAPEGEVGDTARDNEYIDTGLTIDSVYEVENPVKNGVYTLSGSLFDVATDETMDTFVMNSSKVASKRDAYALKLVADYFSIDEPTLTANNETGTSTRVIFYHGQWYTFSDDNDVLCPVEGIVDYIYELIKGEY